MATILELAELSNAVYTGIGFRPFSKSLEVASWRRSWKVSVKETMSEASIALTCEGHEVRGCDDQAPTGAMKPYLVRALIQRGALRWTESAS